MNFQFPPKNFLWKSKNDKLKKCLKAIIIAHKLIVSGKWFCRIYHITPKKSHIF